MLSQISLNLTECMKGLVSASDLHIFTRKLQKEFKTVVRLPSFSVKQLFGGHKPVFNYKSYGFW